MSPHLPLDNELRSGIRLRLEQDRVHIRMRRNTGGKSLQSLGAADFTAIACHGGIVGHILWFERNDFQAAVREYPAQAGNQH